MCTFARLISFVFLMISVMPLQAPRLLAQTPRPDPKAISKDAAPGTQTGSQSEGLPGKQASAGQGRSENEPEGQQQAHSSPSAVPSDAFITGTVTDVNGSIVPGANVVLDAPLPEGRRATVASDNGAFQFDGLRAGVPYQITIAARDLETWKSQPIILAPGQYFIQMDIKMVVPDVLTSVTVYADQEHIATEQVAIETKQRIFGVIPNFYVTYDANPAPLSTKLKFKLALKADTDVMTFVGVAFMAGIYQAADTPDYGQGAEGFGKRMGAGYADSTTDIFIGGAILPSLLRQDPRYFYQGTGTKKSRAFHALSSPVICRGDNGHKQFNLSSLGGDLASGAISNFYYPESNRGVGLVFEGFMVTTGVRAVSALMQEFFLRKLTPSARNRK
jgi:Carboxypeptidase regulatory-like domain